MNQNIEQLLVTMDGLAADGADSRSMLERMTEDLLDNPKAANRAGQIEDRIRVHTEDFPPMGREGPARAAMGVCRGSGDRRARERWCSAC